MRSDSIFGHYKVKMALLSRLDVAQLENLAELAEEGKITPVVKQSLLLAAIDHASGALEARGSRGMIPFSVRRPV